MGYNQYLKRTATFVKIVVGQGVAKNDPNFSGNEGDGIGLAIRIGKEIV